MHQPKFGVKAKIFHKIVHKKLVGKSDYSRDMDMRLTCIVYEWTSYIAVPNINIKWTLVT